jgi:hypothetical protein
MNSGVRVPLSLQSIFSSKLSWTTTHRQRLMYGVNMNLRVVRHAALYFMVTRLQARAVDAAPRFGASKVMRM